MAAERKVMIKTAARVEISYLAIPSRRSHSALSMRGMTFRAFHHMATFIDAPYTNTRTPSPSNTSPTTQQGCPASANNERSASAFSGATETSSPPEVSGV